ncbi:MAG: nucleotide sugar dehydrogenase [Nitrososphaerales archaeon]
MRNLSVSIVGLGYVGLTTAACFASRGIKVVGVDVDKGRVRKILVGEPVIKERGLQPLLDRGLRRGYLEFRSDLVKLDETDVSFITVGTPGRRDGSIDTSYVEGAAKEIGHCLRSRDDFHLVVVKSTVVPGTTVGKVKPVLEAESRTRIGDRIGLAVNPEFLREGSAVRDTLQPEALVVGASNRKSSNLLLSLYREFYGRLPPTISTTLGNAELIKYSINAARALQVSYVNFLANICSRIESGEMRDVVAGLARIARLDKRYLGAGLGYGGSCLPKDTKALFAFAQSIGVDASLLDSVIGANERQALEAVKMARKLVGTLNGKKAAVLGLAFKAGTDDVRESTAIRVIWALLNEGAEVVTYDPEAAINARSLLGNKVTYAASAKNCFTGADICIVATGWDEFKALKPSQFRRLMRSPAVVDGRRIFDPKHFRTGGVRFLRVGTAASTFPTRES